MSEIIRLGAENPSETQNFFKGVAEKYKDPNNQQVTLTGFSSEIREKLNIKGPNYVPGYDFSQAIIEQALHNKERIDRRGGLQKTSEDFLEFIEKMGINPQDPSVPLKKLTEEYLLRPYSSLPPSEPPPAPTMEIEPSPTPEKTREAPEIPEKAPASVNAQTSAEEQTASQLTEELNKNNAYYFNRLGEVQSTNFTTQQELSDKEKFNQLSKLKGWPSGSKPRVRLKADNTWEMMSFQSQQKDKEAAATTSINAPTPQEPAEAAVLPPTEPQQTEEAAGVTTTEASTTEEPTAPAQPETPEQRTGRLRNAFATLSDLLAQPGERTTALRERLATADRETFNTLVQAVRSLASRFRRTPEEQAEAETAEREETPEQRENRLIGALRWVNEFLAQPGDAQEEITAADRQASENLRQALGSLVGRVPDLFRRTPQEETGETTPPTEPQQADQAVPTEAPTPPQQTAEAAGVTPEPETPVEAETAAAAIEPETPAQRTSRIRRMLGGLRIRRGRNP